MKAWNVIGLTFVVGANFFIAGCKAAGKRDQSSQGKDIGAVSNGWWDRYYMLTTVFMDTDSACFYYGDWDPNDVSPQLLKQKPLNSTFEIFDNKLTQYNLMRSTQSGGVKGKFQYTESPRSMTKLNQYVSNVQNNATLSWLQGSGLVVSSWAVNVAGWGVMIYGAAAATFIGGIGGTAVGGPAGGVATAAIVGAPFGAAGMYLVGSLSPSAFNEGTMLQTLSKADRHSPEFQNALSDNAIKHVDPTFVKSMWSLVQKESFVTDSRRKCPAPADMSTYFQKVLASSASQQQGNN